MDVLEQLVGIVLITVGIALFSIPAAIMAFGIILVGHGVMREMLHLNERDEDGVSETSTQ